MKLTTLPAFSIDSLTSALSYTDRNSIRRSIKAEIEARYATEESASASVWEALYGAGKFVFDAVVGETLYMAIDAYKNMLATGANPLTALYVVFGVFAGIRSES